MNAPQRLAAREALQALDAEREFAQGQRPLHAAPAGGGITVTRSLSFHLHERGAGTMGEAKNRKVKLHVLQQQASMRVVPREAAEKYEWLEPLARAYATADMGIADEFERRAAAGKPPVACHRGCHECCLAPALLVNQLEIRGLSWFLAEVMVEPARSRVREQIRRHRESAVCPLLLDGECSVDLLLKFRTNARLRDDASGDTGGRDEEESVQRRADGEDPA